MLVSKVTKSVNRVLEEKIKTARANKAVGSAVQINLQHADTLKNLVRGAL